VEGTNFTQIRHWRIFPDGRCIIRKSHLPNAEEIDWDIRLGTTDLPSPIAKLPAFLPIKLEKKTDIDKIMALNLLSSDARYVFP